MNKKELASYIDQTLLSPCATGEEVISFCQKAKEYGFASVCINPSFVELASKILKGSATKVCTVIDFPLGAGGLETKLAQTDIAITQGADELDYVVNLSYVKSHSWQKLTEELKFIEKAAREASLMAFLDQGPKKVVLKLIIETCYLSDEEIIESCKAAKNANFDFVKTSTGFAILKDEKGFLLPNGAAPHAVSLMRQTVGPEMGVKASGGIHSAKEALDLIAAGASRIGSSSGVKIVDGLEEEE